MSGQRSTRPRRKASFGAGSGFDPLQRHAGALAASLMVSTAIPAGPPAPSGSGPAERFQSRCAECAAGRAASDMRSTRRQIAAASPTEARTGAARLSLPEIESKLASPLYAKSMLQISRSRSGPSVQTYYTPKRADLSPLRGRRAVAEPQWTVSRIRMLRNITVLKRS